MKKTRKKLMQKMNEAMEEDERKERQQKESRKLFVVCEAEKRSLPTRLHPRKEQNYKMQAWKKKPR